MWKSAIVFSGVVFGVALWPTGQAGAQTERQLEKHEHGHVEVNMAIEGRRVQIELHAPGMDIVGFEHPARSAADKEAVEKAEEMLKQPLVLIAPAAAAGCTVESAKVMVAGEEHGHGGHESKPHGHAKEAEQHTEFRAEYVLGCTNIAALDRIVFPFFKAFPRTREIEAKVIGPKGQTAFEVEPDRPEIVLGGAR
jgi:hypothetical protein